jgi:putative toxin-antitoxin system antitoxin component (TIGR02293 family)
MELPQKKRSHRKSDLQRPKTQGRGVVDFCIGRTSAIAGSKFTQLYLIQAIQAGLPVEELIQLQNSLEVPMEKLVPLLGISKPTFHRRKAEGRLGPGESDRVVRFARLLGRAIEVLESEENARQWLMSPQFGLGGAVPLEFAATELGAREVEDLLGRIEYGVYS